MGNRRREGAGEYRGRSWGRVYGGSWWDGCRFSWLHQEQSEGTFQKLPVYSQSSFLHSFACFCQCALLLSKYTLFVLLIKMASFPHLKNVLYLTSSSDCQPCACKWGPVCADHRRMPEGRKLKIWQCCKMLHKVGPRNSRPLCSFVSHDPPLVSLQMEVPVLPPKRGQVWLQVAPHSAGSAAGIWVWNQSLVYTKDPVNHRTSITD